MKSAIPSLSDLSHLLYPYQKRVISDPARFTWNNWSRQTGKSFTLSLRRVLRGIQRGRNQFFLSAGERQSRELMNKVDQHLRAMGIICEMQQQNFFEGIETRQLSITLPASLGSIRIVGLPANPLTARGFTGDVLLDEFAMHIMDREIFAAMFPSIARNNGELDICSTPKGRQNVFYRLKDNDQYSHSTVTIFDAVAQGNPAHPESLQKGIDDDELWRQEFLCEFVDESTAFLTYELIAECEDPTLSMELDQQRINDSGDPVFVGVDIGRKHDLTVIWAFAQQGDMLVSLGMIELHSTSFRRQFEILCSLLENQNVRRCAIDATGLGMQMAEMMEEKFGTYRAQACTFTPAFKSQIAGLMRIKMEDKLIRFPSSQKLRNDLHSIRKDVSQSGQIRLSADRQDGSHADRFWAAALAIHAASEDVGVPEALFGQPLLSKGAW